MPTYSYKGYDFEVDHTPTEAEFQQLSAYVDSLPPKEATPSKADKAFEQVRKDTLAGTEGGLEAAKSLLTGAAAQVAAPVVGGIQKIRSELSGVPTTFEKEYADAIQRMTYEPTSEKGKEIMGNVGEAINRYLLPVAPMLGVTGMGEMRAPKGKAGIAPEALAKEVPEPVKTGTAALLEDLNTPVAPEPKKAPGTPMQNMVEQLTGEPYPEATPFNPVIGQMVEQLPEMEAQARARPIQEAIEARQKQMEFEVQKQTNLDMGAARRAREEAAPTGYREWIEQRDAEELAKRQEYDSEMAKRAGSGEQAGLFEPHTNMHRAYTEFFAGTEEGTRPFSPTEFREILENLSNEPGTAFTMPEDFSAAYKDYLNHAKEGQGDLFGAHEVLQQTSHKPWGELTPQEKARATRALKKIGPITESMQERMLQNLSEQEGGISYLRSGFTAEDMLGKIPGINLRDVGNALIATPENAIQLAKNAPDVSQSGLGKAMNTLTKGGIFLSAKLKNPVVSFSVDRLLQAYSLARAKISDNVHGAYAEALRRLSKEEMLDAKAILDAADMSQKMITPEIMTKHGLSENLKDFIGVHQLLMEDVLKSINDARVAVGKKPITGRQAYSAMSMSGDFRQVVTMDGQTIGVIGKNTMKGLDALREQVLQKFPTAEFSKVQDMTVVQKGGKGSPQAAFMDVLDMMGQENPVIGEFLKVLDEIAKDDATNYMGMQKHTMQKKGVWGMEGRKWWESAETNAQDFFTNQVRYAESAYQWGELAQAAKEVNDVIRNPEVVTAQNNAIRIVEQYMQNAMGVNPSRVGRAVNEFMNAAFGAVGVGPSVPRAVVSGMRSVANTMMLSLSPVFLGMQVIQAPSVLPAMSAFLRGRGAAPMSTILTQGFGHFTQGGWTLTKKLLGKELTEVESGALNYAQKNHVYATDMVEHANQIQKDMGYYRTKITQTPAAIVEQATRAQVYMALVHMMNDAGIKPSQGLYEQAHRFTDMAMVNYGALEKPAIYNSLGPTGSLAYNLKSFTHNELSRWSMYAREISETKNPVPLLTQMATTIAVAGVFGLPFYSQFEQLYDFITGKLGKPRSLTLDVMEASKQFGKHLGPNGQYALSNGAPTMLGVDLSTRLGLGDVIPTSAADAAFAGGGKLYEMGKATGRAVLSPTEANLKSAAINLAPPALQGPLDVAWYQQGDLAMSKNPEKPAKAMARRNATDTLLKKIGLTGINESAQKQRVYQQDQLDRAYANYRTDAMNAISWELMNGKQPSQKNLDKYFKTGQGDPETFIKDIERVVLNQRMTPEEAVALRQSASQRVPQIQSFLRRQ
jgi:hypothetical protein